MKSLRHILVFALVLSTVVSTVFYSSCSKNKCGGTTCQNGGTCTGSKCVCPTGYSGASCERGWSDQSIGTYVCKRSNCNPAISDTATWQSAVTKDATNSGYTIDISNFDKSNIRATGTIDSAGGIRIAPSGGTFGVSATGKCVGGVITLQFTTYQSGTTVYTCNMTMTKL